MPEATMPSSQCPGCDSSVVAELDRQVERGSQFTQAVLQRSFRRLDRSESLLVGLIKVLAAKGVVTEDELGVAFTPTGEEDQGHEGEAGIAWPAIALRVDPTDQPDQPAVEVDCTIRMPICRAVCCRLKFPLSCEEVDAGHVKWDIGHPYVVRHRSNGYCTHNDPSTRGCDVYAHRPSVCRRYSCANDPRIWADFDGMILNQEWIDAHLDARDLRVEAVLPAMEEG